MSENDFNLVRTAGFLLAVGIAVGLQRLSPHARRTGTWQVNLGFWLANLVAVGLVCGACAWAVAGWATRAGVGLLNSFTTPPWVSILITFLALDVVSYAWHRANHQVPFLWRFHQVHHSDQSFTVSTAVRFHPGEILLSLPVRLTAVVALGAPAVAVLIFEVFFAAANLIEHGDINLPARLERRLGWLCITPALHRLHHSIHREERNSNYGTILVIWDRLLRTYRVSWSRTQIAAGLADLAGPIPFRHALSLPLSVFGVQPEARR